MTSNADSQLIISQILMLTNQVASLQKEVSELREQRARDLVEAVSASSSSEPSTKAKKKKAKKEKPDGHIKKPATAFLMWQNEHFRPTYKAEHPDEPPKAVASAAGPVWKAMSDEEKAPWVEQYKAAQAVYHAATGKSAAPKKVVAVSGDTSLLDEVLAEPASQEPASQEPASQEPASPEPASPEPASPEPDAPKEETKAERKARRAAKKAKKAAKQAKEAKPAAPEGPLNLDAAPSVTFQIAPDTEDESE